MKFYDSIGFGTFKETAPGVHTLVIEEKKYRGKIINNSYRLNSTEGANDNFVLSKRVSIIADAYINMNFQNIKYVVINGEKWKTTRFDITPPRLVIDIGGLYNE